MGDITYLPLVGGRWCYLATWRDTCSRRVVGWQLDKYMPTQLVLNTLWQALTLRQPAAGLIIHTDRGSRYQYTSAACRTRIAKALALASFSRPGNPYDNYDNAQAWSTLKTELLPHGGAFATLEEARLEVAYYLDTPTSTSTADTQPLAIARPTSSNATSKPTYLSSLSVFTGPPHLLGDAHLGQ